MEPPGLEPVEIELEVRGTLRSGDLGPVLGRLLRRFYRSGHGALLGFLERAVADRLVDRAVQIEQVAGSDLESADIAWVILLLPAQDHIELLLEQPALLGGLGLREGCILNICHWAQIEELGLMDCCEST